MEKVKLVFSWIFLTWIGRICFGGFLLITGAVIVNKFPDSIIGNIIGRLGVWSLVIFFAIFFVAGIIGMINDRKKTKKSTNGK